MNRTFELAIIPIIFVSIGCGSMQRLESESATKNPDEFIDAPEIFLNGSRISDVAALRSQIDEVVKLREANGVFLEGTNEVPRNVYLRANPKLSVGAFARLFRAIDDGAGTAYIPRAEMPDAPEKGDRLNPLYLEVSTEGYEFPRALGPLIDLDHRYSYNVSIDITKVTREGLKGIRMFTGTLEISADGQYFVNEKQGDDADYGPIFSSVKQRAIEPADLAFELGRLANAKDNAITVIVSDRASYGKLLSVFEAAPGAPEFLLIVRPSDGN